MIKKKLHDDSYYLGRFYSKGIYLNSDGTPSEFIFIIAVCPDGEIVRGGLPYYYLLTPDEEEKLLAPEEAKCDLPYFPHLLLENGKYEKTDEMASTPLEYHFYPDGWWNLNHYLDIDADLFGNALAALFTLYTGKMHYYNKVCATNESKCISTYIPYEDKRDLRFVSPNKYTDKDFYDKYRYPFDEDKYGSQFMQRPLRLPKDAYLIKFSKFYQDDIMLGSVRNSIFYPTTLTSACEGEIIFENGDYPFISEFIKEIMAYKLRNRKPILDEQDMEIILENCGLKRNLIGQDLVWDLSQILNRATNNLMQSTTVNDALARERKIKK